MMEKWKMRAYTEERFRLRRLADDACARVEKLIGEFETFPEITVTEEGSRMASSNCPSCGIHAYHSTNALHQCAVCRRYYYVNFTTATS